MNTSSRYLAFFAYLLSVFGALYVLLARRHDQYAVFHAKQSLVIAATAAATLLAWLIVAWGGAWIPVVGPVIGLSLFALVIAIYLGLAFSWITGLVYALRGHIRPVPLVGTWVLPRRKPATLLPEGPQHEAPQELMERTVIDA